MDKDDLDKWCHEHDYPQIEYLSVTPAKLKDYKLAFNYLSDGRKGGAANVMEARGNIVYGLLVEIKDTDLPTIQDKEGCPNYYREIEVEVETFDGKAIKDVKTYKVIKEKEKNGHVEPTEGYLLLIIQNAIKYGFPKDYVNFLRSVKSK